VRRWIVAHIDSKAQGHSMAGRLVAAWLLLLATLVHSTLAFYRWLGHGAVNQHWVIAAMVLTVAAGALASRGRLRGGSAGARDNGTGLLAALVAAEQVQDPTVGFLLTGAEEFGLIGARVFVRSPLWDGRAEIINVDTIDQAGKLYLVSHNESGARLADRLVPGFDTLAIPAVRRSLPFGILVDSLPFARRGAAAITIARLNWGTLRLLHTPADVADGLNPETAERIGACLARLPAPGALG
jgi:Zn-dependent M28 family amino/carboxypeptidase